MVPALRPAMRGPCSASPCAFRPTSVTSAAAARRLRGLGAGATLAADVALGRVGSRAGNQGRCRQLRGRRLVLIDADPDDKAEIFRKPGLKLACHPARYLVKAQAEAAPHWSLWRRVARALGKVLACLAHRHGRPAGGGADERDRREQSVLPEVVALPPGDLIKQVRLGPAMQGRCGQHRVLDFVVLPAAEDIQIAPAGPLPWMRMAVRTWLADVGSPWLRETVH